MDKTKLKNLMTIGYWVMIVVVIAFCIFLFFYLTKHTDQCLRDPLKYYEVITNQYCSCRTNVAGIDLSDILKNITK